MKVWLIYVLFNVLTSSQSPEIYVVKTYTDWGSCAKDLNLTGPQNPDKNHNIKLYECLAADAKPTVRYTYQ